MQNLILETFQRSILTEQILTEQKMKLQFSELKNGNVLRMPRINTKPEVALHSAYGAGSIGQWDSVCSAQRIPWV